MEKLKNKIVLSIQFCLTLFGTVLAVVLLVRTLKEPTLLGVLSSIVYLVAYLALVFYAIKTYSKKENIYFQGVIYAYAALLGIQILQSGNYISEFGLPQNIALLINCFNIISFANVVKFSDFLDVKKTALAYIIIAVAIKLIIEIYLIVKMFAFIQIIHILMSLSIPILGITIIVAYINRIKRIDEPKNNRKGMD